MKNSKHTIWSLFIINELNPAIRSDTFAMAPSSSQCIRGSGHSTKGRTKKPRTNHGSNWHDQRNPNNGTTAATME